VNWCEALWPVFSVPVSKLPSLAVAVCGCLPWFVQVTVSPTWIVTVAGEKLKSTIVSDGSPAACAVGRELGCRVTGLSPWRAAVDCVVDAVAVVVVWGAAGGELDVDAVVSLLVDVVVLLVDCWREVVVVVVV
jgi:hypothetical protein